MEAWISRQLQRKWLFSLTVMFFIFFSLDSIATAFVSVMIDTTWSELTGTQKWIRVGLIVKAWASSMLALITTTSRKLENGELPIGGDPKPEETKP